jgi:hypothetical protein
MYDLISFSDKIKGLPPKDEFDTDTLFSAVVSGESWREFEVNEFGKLHLLLDTKLIPVNLSDGLQIKDTDNRSFYCEFDSGVLISISRIEYVMIYQNI